jgi:hypothetical protein
MAGKALAVKHGNQLIAAVRALGEALGLEVHEQLEIGRRLWGAKRRIDVVLIDRQTRRTLGIECKYQREKGAAEEKLPSTIQDIGAWPITGIVVFAGSGFTANMEAFLLSTGKAVGLADLEGWLRLYFGLPPADRIAKLRGETLILPEDA